MKREMQRSWLVQRLQKPRNYGQLRDNPFSFGGGLKNGGLSDEAMGLLREIFSFDYMGAAEFEFGAVPQALSRIANQHKRLVTREVVIPLRDVERDWRDRKSEPLGGEAVVYILAAKDEADEVEQRVREWAAKDFTMKEGTHLPRSLRPAKDDWDHDTCGWLELDNGFMFFTDREMWAKTCDLFGVAVPEGVTQ